MKKYLILLVSAFLFMGSFVTLSADDVLIKKREIGGSDIKTRDDLYTPISANITNGTLTVTFEEALGVAVVYVEGEDGILAYNVVRAGVGATWSVSIDSWDAGEYLLTIEIRGDVYCADFEIE
ncbi:DUF3244 domain-containing protein [Paludibacter sp. 221]|uniref:DUF3244 domain-containing protein n=1 Tax=Paludibacter sp. 221 TaxID=2302939 RepID=UPI0013D28722|nr:DUF3244 domain-containing protein [Paludibacter sp. 221]NDV46847.1 DUF3244 domain-containing protein [Paludibacter sp. 221]